MGNRSKVAAAAVAAFGGGAIVMARRARLRGAAEGIREAILPTHVADLPSDRVEQADEAHAPGHGHLGAEPEMSAPSPLPSRPWTKNAHGTSHSHAPQQRR